MKTESIQGSHVEHSLELLERIQRHGDLATTAGGISNKRIYRQFFKVTCDDLTSNDIANLKNFVGHWRSVFRSHRTTLFAEAPQGIARSVENNVARNGPTAVGHKALRDRIAQAYSRQSTVLCK